MTTLGAASAKTFKVAIQVTHDYIGGTTASPDLFTISSPSSGKTSGGGGRTGHGEQDFAAHESAGGSAEDGGGSDFLEAKQAEDFAVTRERFVD